MARLSDAEAARVRRRWRWHLPLVLLTAGCAATRELPLAVREATVMTGDSVAIWYRVVGDGPVTILAPNALFLGSTLDSLATQGRRVVTYDTRNRGRSGRAPLDRVGLDYQFLDLETVATAVSADSFALLGWSGAGMELFVYALRHPGRVTQLVQLTPVAPRAEPFVAVMAADRAARTDSVALNAIYAAADRGDYRDRQRELCQRLAALTTVATLGDTTVMAELPDVCDLPNEWPEQIWPYFGALMQSLGPFDWRPDLGRVAIPRLVIHGERDNTPLTANLEWVNAQPNARLVVIRGAGHWPLYERRSETLAELRKFFDGRG